MQILDPLARYTLIDASGREFCEFDIHFQVLTLKLSVDSEVHWEPMLCIALTSLEITAIGKNGLDRSLSKTCIFSVVFTTSARASPRKKFRPASVSALRVAPV